MSMCILKYVWDIDKNENFIKYIIISRRQNIPLQNYCNFLKSITNFSITYLLELLLLGTLRSYNKCYTLKAKYALRITDYEKLLEASASNNRFFTFSAFASVAINQEFFMQHNNRILRKDSVQIPARSVNRDILLSVEHKPKSQCIFPTSRSQISSVSLVNL